MNGGASPSGKRIVQVGSYGVVYKLREGHSVESVKADVADRPAPLCRWVKHRWQVVGDVHLEEDAMSLHDLALNAIASSDVQSLVKCKRCGRLAERGR